MANHMANLGNTGKRYKIRTVIAAAVNEQGGITVTLDCGHESAGGKPMWSDTYTPEDAQRYVGTRTGCYLCKQVNIN